MSVSVDDVMEAFRSFGGGLVHNQALQAALRKKGFDHSEIIVAINAVLQAGLLSQNRLGEITSP
jgi:hypothetical protein